MTNKDQTPFQCGQTDALFNKPLSPHLIQDGTRYEVSTVEQIKQYIDGYNDSKQFYGD